MTANKQITIALTRSGTPGAWQHFAGNPLDVSLYFENPAAGNTFDGATSLRLELHPDRLINPERAALALLEIAEPTGTTATGTFTAPQMNQDLQGATTRAFWLCVHAVYADEAIANQTFALGTLTLIAHPSSLTVADPPELALGATTDDFLHLGLDPLEVEEPELPWVNSEGSAWVNLEGAAWKTLGPAQIAVSETGRGGAAAVTGRCTIVMPETDRDGRRFCLRISSTGGQELLWDPLCRGMSGATLPDETRGPADYFTLVYHAPDNAWDVASAF